MEISTKKCAQFLLENKKYAILIHDKADGDCFGSAVALSLILNKLSKETVILSPGEIPERLEFINNCDVPVLKGKNALNFDDKDFTVISVDVASQQLLTCLVEKFSSKIQLAIDHHMQNTLQAERLCLNSSASAAGEIIFDILREIEVFTNSKILDENIAFALYASISSDTGCFKFSNVSSRTHEIASSLLKFDIEAHEINFKLFDCKTKLQMDVESLALKNIEYHFDGKVCFVYISNDELSKIGATQNDTETVVQITRSIKGVEIGIFMYEKEPGLFKISARSNTDADVSKLCCLFGGGGHIKAAGCSISGAYEDAKNAFLKEVQKII